MKDCECVDFLQWALPRLRMRWPGFRKVRRQVCKRVDRRLHDLGLPDVAAYRVRLDQHPEEWPILDSFCRISISRFYRDRGVFDALRETVLPEIARRATARGQREVHVWSAGCASGEEPYTLSIVWRLIVQPAFPGVSLRIVATDADEGLLARAQAGCYPASSLKDLPVEWRSVAFTCSGNLHCLAAEYRDGIEFVQQDIRLRQPVGPFHLILCRNLVFTYCDAVLQAELLATICRRLLPGGYLVVGIHESLPPGDYGLSECLPKTGIHEMR
ncbi:MAG: CheR family methyltransferase [Deltaproteobacteria bacterium]